MPKVNAMTRRDWLLLLLILVVASALRLTRLGVISFLYDESLMSSIAQDMADGVKLPLIGLPASVGVPVPPVSVYLMAVPYLFSSSPMVASAYVALLNMAGIGMLYFMARRYVGTPAAVIAGLAFAVNPWAVLYSRRIWTPDLQIPFVILAMLLMMVGFWEHRRWAQVASLPVLLFAGQIHYSAGLLVVIYLWFVWRARKQHGLWWVLLLSGAITILTWVPYIVGLIQYGIADRIAGYAETTTHHALVVSTRALMHSYNFATGHHLEMLSPDSDAAVAALLRAMNVLAPLVILFMILGVVALWRRNRILLVPLALWAAFPTLVFTPEWTIPYLHYVVLSLPAYCLLLALGLTWLGEQAPRRAWAYGGISVFLGALFLTQIGLWSSYLRQFDTRPLYDEPPVHYMMSIRDRLEPYQNVLVISNRYWLVYHKESIAWEVLLHDSGQCVRAIGGDEFAVYPPDGDLAVLLTNRGLRDSPVQALYANDAPTIFPLREGEGVMTLYTYDTIPAWPGPELTPITPALFDSGVQLAGYRAFEGRLYLDWQVLRNDQHDYQYFIHVLNGNGDRIAQVDTNFLPGRYWCSGDRVVTWANLELPEGAATLRVGLYRLDPSGTHLISQSNVLDDAGNQAAPWADIPLVD